MFEKVISFFKKLGKTEEKEQRSSDPGDARMSDPCRGDHSRVYHVSESGREIRNSEQRTESSS